ncbi:MAG: hypothetical protein ACRDCW_00120 [Sarcina sp.]
MPNFIAPNYCSLDQALDYFNKLYQKAQNSQKKSDISFFNTSLHEFITPSTNALKIKNLKNCNYTVEIRFWKNQNRYLLDIYQTPKKKLQF